MATPLLLVVHGRSGGVIPEVYQQLARELEQRRQAPVGLRALTAPLTAPLPVPLPASGEELALWGPGLTLVPLLLLPGNHARVDVPALARQLRSSLTAAGSAPAEGSDPGAAGGEQGSASGFGHGASPAMAGAAAGPVGPCGGAEPGAARRPRSGLGSGVSPMAASAMAGPEGPGAGGEPGAALPPGSRLGFAVSPAAAAVAAGSQASAVGGNDGPGARGAEIVAAAGRNHGPGGEGVPAPVPGVRRLPFLGAWPAWQSALAAELAALADSTDGAWRLPAEPPPLLLHHPLEGNLAPRYLEHLQRRLGCRCLAAPYSSVDLEEPALAIDGPVLPLALAANRLTERLEPRLGRAQAAPLLERPRLRQLLLEQLAALP